MTVSCTERFTHRVVASSDPVPDPVPPSLYDYFNCKLTVVVFLGYLISRLGLERRGSELHLNKSHLRVIIRAAPTIIFITRVHKHWPWPYTIPLIIVQPVTVAFVQLEDAMRRLPYARLLSIW